MTVYDKYREAIKSILIGMALMIGAILFWYHIVGNPLDELALIQRAKVTNCILVDTEEHEEEDYRGHVYYSDVGIYNFRLPDGREFKTTTRVPTGQLDDNLEVEYLPDNPTVNRVKGDGSQSITEWPWRKVGLGSILLVLFISVGFTYTKNGIREILKSNKKETVF